MKIDIKISHYRKNFSNRKAVLKPSVISPQYSEHLLRKVFCYEQQSKIVS